MPQAVLQAHLSVQWISQFLDAGHFPNPTKDVCIFCRNVQLQTIPSIDKGKYGFWGWKQRLASFSSLPGVAQAEDDDNACGYFGRRKACLHVSTDGIVRNYTICVKRSLKRKYFAFLFYRISCTCMVKKIRHSAQGGIYTASIESIAASRPPWMSPRLFTAAATIWSTV